MSQSRLATCCTPAVRKYAVVSREIFKADNRSYHNHNHNHTKFFSITHSDHFHTIITINMMYDVAINGRCNKWAKKSVEIGRSVLSNCCQLMDICFHCLTRTLQLSLTIYTTVNTLNVKSTKQSCLRHFCLGVH